MSTRHLVDPQLAPMLDQFPALSLSAETLADVRGFAATLNEQMKAMTPEFPDIDVGERRVPGSAGAPDVRVLVYIPKSAPRPLPALLWVHGGGYVVGDADGADLELKTIVSAVGCAAVSVDYRLAPET